MRNSLIMLILCLSSVITAQLASYEQFPHLDHIDRYIPESYLLEGAENELIMFWIDSTDLHMSRSFDNGDNWKNPITLYDQTSRLDSLSDLNVLKVNSGRILVTFRHDFHLLIYSDDNGITWSDPMNLVTHHSDITRRRIFESSLSQTTDSKIRFVYNRLNTIFSIQSEDGITWSEMDTIFIPDNGSPHFASIHSHWNDSLMLIYHHEIEDTFRLVYQLSQDGETWNEPIIILDDGKNKTQPRVAINLNNDLTLTYCQYDPTPFVEYPEQNIYWTELPSGSTTWKEPEKVTEYVGFDGWQNTSLINNKTYLSFTSDRVGNGNGLYFGVLGESTDDLTPPKIYYTDIKYQNNDPRVNIFFTAEVFDTDDLAEVVVHFFDKDGTERTIELFDDGMHDDEDAGDFIFGNVLLGIYSSFNYDVYFSAKNFSGNSYNSDIENITSPFIEDGQGVFVFDNNNLIMPINDRGVLADVNVPGYEHGAKYDDLLVIYSAGFALSGYTKGELWANGMMSAARTQDYLHGNIDSIESKNRIHVVRSSQPDFYQSWIDWKDAVNQGAEFYDGNGDGVYDPIDINNNGKWDTNEDKPNLIGDVTAFTVYNDGVDPYYRDFPHVDPQGIEIKQAVFSYNKSTLPELSNVVYVKYRIENMGTVADTLDSVYFGAWADMDIGYAIDDLIGTDSTSNSSYCYNSGADLMFKDNPPACFMTIIQGAPTYILGITFNDLNGNGIYDDGIDEALDTASNRKGRLVGLDNYPGSKNGCLKANIHYVSSHPTQGDPDNADQLRNYMLGYNQAGELTDPCSFEFGEVYNEDCNTINPRLMYSGDPVTQNGWIHTDAYDQRHLGSTGPFDLVKNKPIDIIIAYVVGRGVDSLSSITEARKNVQSAIDFYETNFAYTPMVGVKEEKVQMPEKYVLHQNFPNPFNPSTTISYSIAEQSQVELKVYDVLGREVAELINKEQSSGKYEIQFDASSLTSGIYFYRIQAGSFIESKKMILLK